MKYIKVVPLEVSPGTEFNSASYPADGMYLVQRGAMLISRSGGMAYMITGGPSMVLEMEEAEPQVQPQIQGSVTESTFLKALAMMRDATLVNKFDL